MERSKALEVLLTVVIIFVAVAVFVVYPNLLGDIYNPWLGDKEKLARYYACSIAICNQGCGSDLVRKLCTDRNYKGKCVEYCQYICDSQLRGSSEKFCDEDHAINLTLNSKVKLKGAYGYWKTSEGDDYSWRTELDDIIDTINKTETEKKWGDLFPKIDDYGGLLSDPNTQTFFQCFIRHHYVAPTGPNPSIYAVGLINKEGASFNKEGAGDIILNPNEARELYSCFAQRLGGWPSWTAVPQAVLISKGFYSCEFKGKIKMWAFKTDDLSTCADVAFRNAESPKLENFVFQPDKNRITIPLMQTKGIKLKIKNDLGYPCTFFIKLDEIPDGLQCWFPPDPDKKIESVELDDTQDGSVLPVCKPLQHPLLPNNHYTIKATAQDGSMKKAAYVDIYVGDFNIDIIEEELKIRANEKGTFRVNVTSQLGEPATINLNIESYYNNNPDNDVNCYFIDDFSTSLGPNIQVNIQDKQEIINKVQCSPNANAIGKTYDVKVIGKYGDVERSDNIKVKILTCRLTGDKIKVRFKDPNDNIYGNGEVQSYNNFSVEAYGFEGCEDYTVNFNLSFGGGNFKYSLDSIMAKGDFAKSLEKTADNPGIYIFGASMDINKDSEISEDEYGEATLTISPGSVREKDCEHCDNGNEWCKFSFSGCNLPWPSPDICKHCVWGGKCQKALDPQTCWQDTAEDLCAKSSNICCVRDSNYYSWGPASDAPCLSPDDYTDNTPNPNFWWDEVDKARNVLVYDNDWKFPSPGVAVDRGSYATFTNNDCQKDDDCKASSPLIDAECIDIPAIPELPEWHGAGDCNLKNDFSDKVSQVCKLKSPLITADDWYTSWLFIRISYTSRPVYGIRIISRGHESKIHSANFQLFLHKQNGDWFKVDSIGFIGNKWEINDTYPSNGWSWNEIDAILIGHKFGYNTWFTTNPPVEHKCELSDSWIDYIGLLTKGKYLDQKVTIPFCTDNSGSPSESPFYQTVDNGRKCYWGVNCPSAGNGWEYKDYKTTIGPISNIELCDCNNGDCGKGYCSFPYNGENYCFYNVSCGWGGWMTEGLKKCELGESCNNNNGGSCSIPIPWF